MLSTLLRAIGVCATPLAIVLAVAATISEATPPIEGQKNNVARATNGSPVLQGRAETHHDITNRFLLRKTRPDACHSERSEESGLFRGATQILRCAQDDRSRPSATEANRRTNKLPQAKPGEVGMNSARLAAIDQIVAEGLDRRAMPGCVVLVARCGKIVWLKAYGDRQVQPDRAAMTVDTCFDLASLTKPVATATSVMILRDQHKLRPEEAVARYLPEFAENGKERITIEQLLTHQGGLIADNALADYANGPEQAWRRILAQRPKKQPGKSFVYSDVGFLVLGELVHRVSGRTLDTFAKEHIFQPLGMTETGFLPAEPLRRRAAPTERREGRWMRGEVHDPRAYALGSVAGHAGLFATAADLAVYAQMLLDGGEYHGVRVLSREVVADMTTPRPTAGGLRGLGWDMRTSYSSNRSPAYSERAFGHGGFTGTGMWIDPARQMTVIFLSNRLHPDGKGAVNPLIARIGTAAVESLQADSQAR